MSDDPGFLNEQRVLYQTICRAREVLSAVLRVVALTVAPRLVLSTWSTDVRNEEMTLLGEDDSGAPPGP